MYLFMFAFSCLLSTTAAILGNIHFAAVYGTYVQSFVQDSHTTFTWVLFGIITTLVYTPTLLALLRFVFFPISSKIQKDVLFLCLVFDLPKIEFRSLRETVSFRVASIFWKPEALIRKYLDENLEIYLRTRHGGG